MNDLLNQYNTYVDTARKLRKQLDEMDSYVGRCENFSVAAASNKFLKDNVMWFYLLPEDFVVDEFRGYIARCIVKFEEKADEIKSKLESLK